jgi:dTMP kinase
LLLDVDLELGRARSQERAGAPDRLERERDDFFAAVASAYRELWREDPERVRRIDAARPLENVVAASLEQLADLL